MESMRLASGCGCKEVYRFPHINYPYCSCICSFLQQYLYFCSFKNVFRSWAYIRISSVVCTLNLCVAGKIAAV